jgi:hypothetical protein
MTSIPNPDEVIRFERELSVGDCLDRSLKLIDDLQQDYPEDARLAELTQTLTNAQQELNDIVLLESQESLEHHPPPDAT